MATQDLSSPPLRRRDRQRHETRRDLALAAFDLANAHGLVNVRVPEIARAAGVSTRTFNNYFSSKEEAIAWPATRRAARMARNLLDRPPDEPLAESLVAAIVALYGSPRQDGLPARWLRGFRTLVATEPSLHGEYLKSSAAAEDALAVAIARRMQVAGEELRPRVLAAIVVGAERAAVRHWIEQKDHDVPLVEVVRAAVQTGVSGIEGKS